MRDTWTDLCWLILAGIVLGGIWSCAVLTYVPLIQP